jgi:hypothetical protein
MKKMLDKITVKWLCEREKLISRLADDEGSGFFEDSSKIIIVIVLAVFAIGALLYMFRDTIIPSINEKIQEIFGTNVTPGG